jgi:putative transposase
MAVVLQFIWQTSGDVALTPQAIERLDPYITRYARTMGILVHAVGGTEDHLHVLFDLPLDKTLKAIETELRKTTTRFVRETVTLLGFAWAEDTHFASITPDECDEVIAYIRDSAARHASGDIVSAWESLEEEAPAEEAVPEWLRSVSRSG